jgi:hypothetical protein
MHEEPQREHRWLERLVGRWKVTSEANMGEGEPMKSEGEETVRSLGGMWIIGEGSGSMPGGGEMKSIITLGYNPAKSRFVGTFIASVMTHLWPYEGTLNDAQTVLTLDSEGPSFTGEGMAKYQDVIEMIDDNYRTLTARVLNPDGQWQEFMKAHYRRM